MYVNARATIEREGPAGTEVLVQVRDRPGAGGALELPGGTLEEFEPLLDGLAREVREETGLEVTELLDDAGRLVWAGVRPDGAPGAVFECFRPAFVYETLRGPHRLRRLLLPLPGRGHPRPAGRPGLRPPLAARR
jgi:8-oxo-dGTP diphosphatase